MTVAIGASPVDPGPWPDEALRRRPGGRRRRLRRRARRGLRPARAQRRRQDDDGRDPRGPARPRRRRGHASSAIDVARDADALKPRIGVSLQTAALYPKLTVTELIDLFRSFYPRARPTAELIEALDLGERRNAADPGPLRRPAPAAGGRPGPRQRPGAGLPRRADDRASIRRPAARCGTSSVGCKAERPDGPADDPLHGGGRGPVRSARDHGPRPDPRDGHGRRARQPSASRSGPCASTAGRARRRPSSQALPAVTSRSRRTTARCCSTRATSARPSARCWR